MEKEDKYILPVLKFSNIFLQFLYRKDISLSGKNCSLEKMVEIFGFHPFFCEFLFEKQILYLFPNKKPKRLETLFEKNVIKLFSIDLLIHK